MITQQVWALSWVSFFWSCGSFMVFSLLPTFITEVLGGSRQNLGFIEGICLFSAFMVKLFSGVLSDYWRRRKVFIMGGTFLGLLVKVGFALSASMTHIFWMRFIDRVAKGVRAAPTDALLGESISSSQGKAYGVRQGFYSLGNVVGGALASALLLLFGENSYRLVFACALIPSLFALFIIYSKTFQHQEFALQKSPPSYKNPFKGVSHLGPEFWKLMGVVFFFSLARFSTAFLNLRLKEVGWSLSLLPIIFSLFELSFAAVSFGIGYLSGSLNRFYLLFAGILVLMGADFWMMGATTKSSVVAGILMCGVHLGMTEGLVASLISETTPTPLKGTAFGIFYLISGFAFLLGNNMAGFMSDLVNSSRGAFGMGSICTVLSALALYWWCLKDPDKKVIQNQ